MARQATAKTAKQPMVAEAAVEYETRPIAEVFWPAFKELSREDQGAFPRKVMEDPFWFEDLADAIAIMETRGEPTRPHMEIREEMIRDGLLRAIESSSAAGRVDSCRI